MNTTSVSTKIITNPSQIVLNPFKDFEPVLWCPQKLSEISVESRAIYSIKRNHGVAGTFKLHNLNDAINDGRPTDEKIVIEYIINKCSYIIFTVADLLSAPFSFDARAEGNIKGELAERIARRVTKYFLKHLSKSGRTGGIFDQRFDPQHRDDFLVAHTDDFVLKIQQYPNLIILKRTGKGKYGYENIKELDGFFDYRYQGQHHILVLESKLEKINVDCDDLVNNLFKPLRTLFPSANFSYVLFTDKNSIFVRNTFDRYRQLKLLPAKIHERLKAEKINTLFFSFNESYDDFDKMKDFLIMQYRTIKNLGVTFRGKTVVTDRELIVFDGGETPHIKLVKDLSTGLWHEVPLRHKN